MALVDRFRCIGGTVAFIAILVVGVACSSSAPGVDPPDTGGPDADVPLDLGFAMDASTDAAVDASLDAATQYPDAQVMGSGAVRIVSWNIERLGAPGTVEYQATRAVLARLNADIVALNEVDSPDLANLNEFAAQLGYDYVLVSPSNPFGSIRNAVLSRLAPIAQQVWTSAELSGDPNANDVTRHPLSMTTVAANGQMLTLVVQHWNSGAGNGEEFLRAVDSFRVGQIADRVQGEVVVLGDLNAEVGDSETPAFFTEIPSTLVGMRDLLGADIAAVLSASGLRNDVFAPLTTDRGLKILSLFQADGEVGTRDASGRRLDYILVSDAVHQRMWLGEVYDARDDGLSNFGYVGNAPLANATMNASDHFPVVADIIP